jgi:lipoteichoic acid synthase
MFSKILPFKNPIKFLVAVSFMVGFLLFFSDLINTAVYRPKVDRVPFEFIKILFYDFGIGFIFFLLFLLPFLLISRFFDVVANTMLAIFAFLIIFINVILNQYYATAHVPLGSDIFGYSYAEIIMIVNTSSSFNINTAWPFVFFPGLLGAMLYYLRFYTKKTRYLFIPMVLGMLYFIVSPFLDANPLTNLSFFAYESLEYKASEQKITLEWEGENKYPLLNKNNLDKDVLGDNLNLGKVKPNIVILVVEGLGSDFMGEGAQYKGFTPFLDSLADKSLFWNNFMSNAGRSFGALPSILGSAPFGEKGFLELKEIPNHLSLISLLKQNNYLTSYFEGGESSFDRKINYINYEGIDNITDQNNYGPEYKKTTGNDEGFSWGYPDAEIFKKTLTLLKPVPQPRFDIILTISNHEPFIIPNQQKYLNQVKTILDKSKFDSEEIENIEEYDEVFSALLYTDESIKNFINSYKNSPNYSNTIFIITGDHRLIPVPQKNEICRFHVPLIIFSPMLKQPQKFKGISSHLDIMPSILAMLKTNYNATFPEKLPFVGLPLNSSKTFINDRQIPLMRHKGTFKDLVNNTDFLSGNQLYTIKNNLVIEETSGASKLFEMQGKIQKFQKINKYVTSSNMIMPSSMVLNTNKNISFTTEQKKQLAKLTKSNVNGENFLKARELAFNSKRKEALLLCDLIIKDNPNHYDTRTLKGRIFAWGGNYKKAEEEFRFVINRNPTYKDAYLAIVNMYLWDNQHKPAKEIAEMAKTNLGYDKEFIAQINKIMAKF